MQKIAKFYDYSTLFYSIWQFMTSIQVTDAILIAPAPT